MSVENEKDFSPPIKKLKVDKDDLVGEEHNTYSVTSLSDREIFDIWCIYWRVTYKDEEEEVYRFGIFQKALKLHKTEDELHPNYPALADKNEEELTGCWNPYICKSYISEMMEALYGFYGCIPKREKDFSKLKDSVGEDNTDSVPKVENEKDFAKLIDSVGEEDNTDCVPKGFPKLIDSVEDNTDSVPKVENEKDFAPPIKKLKVDMDDLVGEEHNADSVTSLSDREIFDIWCKFWQVTYKDKEEEVYRFGIFQKALKLDKTEDELHPNYPVLADYNEEELKGCCNAYICKSYVDEMMEALYGCITKRALFDS